MFTGESRPTDTRVAKLARAMLRRDNWAVGNIRLAEASRNEDWMKVERYAVVMLKMADSGVLAKRQAPVGAGHSQKVVA